MIIRLTKGRNTMRRSVCVIAAVLLLLVVSTSSLLAALVGPIYAAAYLKKPGAVCKGCTTVIVISASDCDTKHPEGCMDELVFSGCPGSPPARQPNGSYYGETLVTVDWVGDRTFTITVDDKASCGMNDDDNPVEVSVSITGYEVTSISDDRGNPPGPVCVGEQVTFLAGTSPGAGSVDWIGGDTPSSGTGAGYTTKWLTPGNKTLTAGCGCNASLLHIEVLPSTSEMQFLAPSGTVGGCVRVRLQVRTQCTSVYSCVVKAVEDTGLHTPHEEGLGWPREESVTTEGKVTTTVYMWDWQTGRCHNGPYRLEAHLTFRNLLGQQEETVVEGHVNVCNLVVTSISNDGIVAWKGELGATVPFTVTLADHDTSVPTDLDAYLYATNRGYSYSPIVLHAHGISGGSYTFNWDGSTGIPGYQAEPGLYAIDVNAIQTHVNEYGCMSDDSTYYRSGYLRIDRVSDEAEYYGYDDKGTPDTSDDDFLYIVRKYILYGNGSEGVLWLYDPDLTRAHQWDIASLKCIDHNANDGLTSGTHSLLVPVPVSKMPYAGTYRFVTHVRDTQPVWNRDHLARWAVDLNQVYISKSAAVWVPSPTDRVYANGLGAEAAGRLKKAAYRPYPPEGDPGNGGSGFMANVPVRLAIRTLNRLSPGDPPADGKYCTKNAVWAYFYHGFEPKSVELMSGLVFGPGDYDGIFDSGLETVRPEMHRYNIDQFSLGHVKLAYLAACYSGGCTKADARVDAVHSLAQKFVTSGAKCAVGFEDSFLPALPGFQSFNRRFWEALCEGKSSVGDAVDAALNWRTEHLGTWRLQPLRPVVRGDRNVKL